MVKKKEYKPSQNKRAAITNLILLVVALVLVNIFAGFVFTRLDLTAEKRYTLNPATISMLKKLPDIVYVKVYLKGDLPANYRRLSNATKEMLDEFRAYSNNIEYEFINPSESSDEKERRAIYQQLLKEGLTYTTPVEEKEAGLSQKLIWPGALVTYRNKTMPLQLLKSQTYRNEEEMVSRSINDLEYELTNIIRKLGTVLKPRIAFLEGHQELDSLQTMDMSMALEEYYNVERIRLDSNLTSLVERSERDDSISFFTLYKALIIAKPQQPFSEKDKYLIDQYIMRGGKVLWLIDRVQASMDSLNNTSTELVYPLDLNIDDQLFKYGARINPNLVMDLRSASIPLVTGRVGNQPRMQFFKWYYFPLSLPASNHPVVNNLNAIRFEFAGSIDTVGAPGIKKTVLLSSSVRSQVINAPARISLNILREQPDPSIYRLKNIPLAVLLEGRFESNFKNNIRQEIRDNKKFGFLEQAEKPGKMIIVADGDVIRNNVSATTGRLSPLGYDRYTGELFGNKDFLLNCVNYLCDDSGLIGVRSRTAKLRMLDDARIKKERASIQVRNVVIPILILFAGGIALNFIRRRRYGRQPKK